MSETARNQIRVYKFSYYLGWGKKKISRIIRAINEDAAFAEFWVVMKDRDAHCVSVEEKQGDCTIGYPPASKKEPK